MNAGSLRRMEERINGLSIRERGLLLLAVFAVIFLLWDFLWLQPLDERRDSVRNQLEQVSDRVSSLTSTIQDMAAERAIDPNLQLRQEKSALEAETDALARRLEQRHGGIATPSEAIGVLAGLLGEQTGVDIITLENLPADPLRDVDGNPVPGLFVHRVRVVVESDFQGIRDYLKRIETLPEGVFWESLALRVPGWPTNRIELMLYSLALDDHWLGV
jgi:MSHA biogenesis protein MshJ